MSVCQSFRPVAQVFPQLSTFFLLFFFGMEKGYSHIDMLKTFPGDTDCKYIYIYGFVV